MDILLGLALSQHLNFNQEYNSIHPHIRLHHDSYIAGAFYNSEKRVSAYAGYRWDIGDFGFEAGAANNYPKLGGIVPYLRYTYDLSDNAVIFASPSGEAWKGEINKGIVIGLEIIAFK